MNSNFNSNADKNVLIASAILFGGFFLLTNRKIKQLEREIKKIESTGGGGSGGGGGGGGGTSLANTLLAGNSAGSSNIDKNQQKIQNVSELNSNGNILVESTSVSGEITLRVEDPNTSQIKLSGNGSQQGDVEILATGSIFLGDRPGGGSGNETSIKIQNNFGEIKMISEVSTVNPQFKLVGDDLTIQTSTKIISMLGSTDSGNVMAIKIGDDLDKPAASIVLNKEFGQESVKLEAVYLDEDESEYSSFLFLDAIKQQITLGGMTFDSTSRTLETYLKTQVNATDYYIPLYKNPL